MYYKKVRVSVKEVCKYEYFFESDCIHSPYIEYNLKLYPLSSRLIAAYSESKMVALMLIFDDEKCYIGDYISYTNDISVLESILDYIKQNTASNSIGWDIDDNHRYYEDVLIKNGFTKAERKSVFSIDVTNKAVLTLASPIVKMHTSELSNLEQSGIKIISFADYADILSGDSELKQHILDVTTEDRKQLVECAFSMNKGSIENDCSFVLLKENQISAYVINTIRDSENLENVFIYTAEKYRGNGYGKLLTMHMVGAVIESSYKKIRFYVRKANVISYNMVNKYLSKFTTQTEYNKFLYIKHDSY